MGKPGRSAKRKHTSRNKSKTNERSTKRKPIVTLSQENKASRLKINETHMTVTGDAVNEQLAESCFFVGLQGKCQQQQTAKIDYNIEGRHLLGIGTRGCGYRFLYYHDHSISNLFSCIQGYRSVRATHCASAGLWFYEVKILNQSSSDGHIRLVFL